MKFSNVVGSEVELRALMGGPVAPPVVEKTLSSLDRHCVAFIGRAPLPATERDGWTFRRRAMLRAS
jgi:hypothetical protein